MRIAELFHPTSADDFLLDYFGQQPLHSAGPAERFARFVNAASADQLTWDLERELDAPVVAETLRNTPEPGRGARDLIVVQITGATRWTIYDKDGPSAGEPESAFSLEAGAAISLEPGSALYLPRAFWRSIHIESSPVTLILSIQNPTGADLIDWMVGKIKETEIYQADLPRFAGPAAQTSHLTKLRKTLGGFFRTPSLLESYARRLNRLAPLHAVHGRPFTGSASPEEFIALATPRNPRIFRTDRETIHLLTADRELFFPEDAAPLLQYVLDRAPVAVAEFFKEFAGEFDQDELSSFLAALSRDGVITMIEPALL
jgi:hypothetical protein